MQFWFFEQIYYSRHAIYPSVRLPLAFYAVGAGSLEFPSLVPYGAKTPNAKHLSICRNAKEHVRLLSCDLELANHMTLAHRAVATKADTEFCVCVCNAITNHCY